MTDALEGPRVKPTTLREQANAPRIGRARFIGHAIGIVLLIAAVVAGLAIAGLREAQTINGQPAMLPNRWVAIVGSLLGFVCLVDLAVRRRHDRGQSGADCAALLVLLELIAIGGLSGVLGSVPRLAVSGVAGLAGLYLLVALAVLPGTPGPNQYGPDPRIS
jgi:uncharacterized membrane protein YhaH (DUF805 family)